MDSLAALADVAGRRSDDGMSSISPGEVALRQSQLDMDSAAFLGAVPVGVYVDATELYSDGTCRPSGMTVAEAPHEEYYIGSRAGSRSPRRAPRRKTSLVEPSPPGC